MYEHACEDDAMETMRWKDEDAHHHGNQVFPHTAHSDQ